MKLPTDLVVELKEALDGTVLVDPLSLSVYSTDASIYSAEPLAVTVPRHADDVRALIEAARKHRLPLLPRGGGTSLEGQAVNEAIVFDCSRHLSHILEVNAEEGWARVEPGVVQDQLSRHVAEFGLKFGPDTATGNRATLGGMIGNNSAGSHSIVYGKTIDHVIELRCVLADGSEVLFGPLDRAGLEAKQRLDGIEGRIYRTVSAAVQRQRPAIAERYPKIMRRVTGYNLDALATEGSFNMAELIVGSEATLATILEAKVQLVPRPPATALGVMQFEGLVECMEAARLIVTTGPSAVELIDRLVISQARAQPRLARVCGFVQGDPAAVLITEYSGDTVDEVTARVEGLRQLLERQGLGYGFHIATEPAAQERVWMVRKAGLSLMLGLRGDAKPIAFVEDTAVDVDRLPQYVQRLQAIVRDHDTWAGFYGHASVGCLHFRPVINLKCSDDVVKLRSIAEQVRDLVVEFGGALSGEHGDGRTRTEYLQGYFGDELYGAFRDIKTAFDPEGRLNPGNICDPHEPLRKPPPYVIDAKLRYGATYRAFDPARHLDWSREGGFDRAVEMCNGNGHCRKTDSGTMCPSYMATLDEEHSTRGRANALRAVISGALPPEAFTGARLFQTLDLCLECKGCRGECPSNVDMAKLKHEFLASYYNEHGVPARAHLFGNVARLSRWGSRFAPVFNWLFCCRWVRRLNGKLLGIAPERHLPLFRRHTFESWFRARRASGSRASWKRDREDIEHRQVVLFHDTFMNYNVPAIGVAAVRVLEAAGYNVHLESRPCCGRPLLSNGLVSQARDLARENVKRLAPWARQGVPIIGCEPSCLLMLREDYADLLPADPDAELVASRALMIEEFLRHDPRKITEEDKSPADRLRLRKVDRTLLVHGHCHQKALVGLEPTVELLQKVPGYRLMPLDTGCCGMAGSFGYKVEHYDLSMAIGELALLPAVRAEPEAGIAAAGMSCRQQVEHGTGRRARHPIQWVADALIP